ncbi:PrgH/EprH family type III secretion apparatus protein, partial [Priestia megaterium]
MLNGPLQGCEFPLAESRTLFIVAPLELLDAHVVSVPEDAIFVPLEQGGCNFEVLPGDSDLEGVTLHLL